MLDEAGFAGGGRRPGDSPPDPATRQGRVPSAGAAAPTLPMVATRLPDGLVAQIGR
jgi:hypothetical protein